EVCYRDGIARQLRAYVLRQRIEGDGSGGEGVVAQHPLFTRPNGDERTARLLCVVLPAVALQVFVHTGLAAVEGAAVVPGGGALDLKGHQSSLAKTRSR